MNSGGRVPWLRRAISSTDARAGIGGQLEPEDDEVSGRGLDDEVGVSRAGGGRVAITWRDHLALISHGAVQEVEELGVGVLVWITSVAGVGLHERDEVPVSRAEHLCPGVAVAPPRGPLGVAGADDVPTDERFHVSSLRAVRGLRTTATSC